MNDTREWLKIMLAEVDRKCRERREALAEMQRRSEKTTGEGGRKST